MPFADLDAVTVDGYGTLVELADPVNTLVEALAATGLSRSREDVAAAFDAEARYYRPRSHLGRDAESLAALRRDCVAVFLGELGAELEPESFVEAFVAALVFTPVAGAVQTLERLAGRTRLAVVANWDCSLHEHLDRLGLARFFEAVVTSADAGVAKPDPAIFRKALERLGVEPARALHVGDERIDEEGALAAGMAFRPAPLAAAFAGLE
jgi:HAD superfamily hydrolase (TIGR01509 family)